MSVSPGEIVLDTSKSAAMTFCRDFDEQKPNAFTLLGKQL